MSAEIEIMSDVEMNVPPSSPHNGKRKAQELAPASSGEIVFVGEKKPKLEPTPQIVRLDRRSLGLVQKNAPALLSGSLGTLTDLIEWKKFYASHPDKLDKGLPEQFHSLVVQLCHESDKTLPALARQLRSELIPETEVSSSIGTTTSKLSALEVLPISHLEPLIMSLLDRVNYGLSMETLGLAADAKLPQNLTIWRWEAKDRAKHLPADTLAQLETRYQERLQAVAASKDLWKGLAQAKRDELLAPPSAAAKSVKGKDKAADVDEAPPAIAAAAAVSNPSPEKKEKKPKKEKVEKPIDPEKARKEVEKAERKAQKEAKAKEKQDKEDKDKKAKQKQAAMFASFMGKPSHKKASPVKETREQTTDYKRTFLPFETQKNVTLAPINRFRSEKSRPSTNQDMEEVELTSHEPADLLSSFISSIPKSHIPGRVALASLSLKSGPIKESVRDLVARSQEAELSGNDDPHRITAELRNSQLFRKKFLQFREDTRPPYFGTWTQSSTTIGPRTPFGLDTTLFDYGYDSGDEWDAEADLEGEDIESLDDSPRRRKPGGDVGGTADGAGSMWDTDDEDESFGEEDDDEDDEGSDEEGSEDGWMVDEDEGVAGAGAGAGAGKKDELGTSIEIVEDDGVATAAATKSSSSSAVSWLQRNRKKGKQQKAKKWEKKKKEVKGMLVPFIRGPVYEETFGVSAWDGFESYRIQLLNDTPSSIDPFTFVAAPVLVETAQAPSSMTAVASSLPKHLSTMPPPTLPASASSPSASSSIIMPINAPLVARPTPKKPFPPAHLPAFLTLIAASTKTQILLAAELHEHFKTKGVTKQMVDFELKRRAVREGKKDGSPWKVVDWEGMPSQS